ncbi:hypothetical protein ACIBF6_13735 [Streptosporangium amethystogenes]|uniref:hypothetical protein n=1 Tax=Streptosporangium amethystogenes TaxID=2002 RepID=UPI0037B86B6D
MTYPPPWCPATPATESSRNSARTAAGSCWARGHGLAATIGGFDADIEVVGPAELKDAFAHLAGRYADAAAGAPGTPPPTFCHSLLL